MKNASSNEVEEVKGFIRNGFKKEGLKRILELFRKHNVIELSLKNARYLVSDAKAELAIFSDSTVKESLCAVADYTLSRGK